MFFLETEKSEERKNLAKNSVNISTNLFARLKKEVMGPKSD